MQTILEHRYPDAGVVANNLGRRSSHVNLQVFLDLRDLYGGTPRSSAKFDK